MHLLCLSLLGNATVGCRELYLSLLCDVRLLFDFGEVSLGIFVGLFPISHAVTYFLSSFLMFLTVQGSPLFLYSSNLGKTCLENFCWINDIIKLFFNILSSFLRCCVLIIAFRSMQMMLAFL